MNVTRRTFLETAAAATACATALPRRMWADPLGLPIGIQLYTIREAMAANPAAALKALRKIGYQQVETAGFAGKTVKEFRAMLDDAGLVCPSAHVSLEGADLGPAFSDVHALGTAYATSSSFPSLTAKDLATADDFKRLAARINGIGQKAKAAGLRYAYHNHNQEFLVLPEGGRGYDFLLSETDPALVSFEADCGWFWVAGADPVAYFQKFPGRFHMMHVKDFGPMAKPTTSFSRAGRPEGIELGRGFVKYKPIFDAAKAGGIKHIFVEQEGKFEHSEMESAKVDYDFLHAFS